MARYGEQPVANGIRTDHPIPNLPFVDDSHIPIDDPKAIERVGRHAGTDMWGRCDHDETSGEWMAFTTDPQDHVYSWVIRHHPEHGRSVLLHRGRDAAAEQVDWFGDRPLLTRLGGYWWNGETWYRPRQVLNWASERYMRRPVRQPTTITAADLLDSSCKTALGEIHKILQLNPGANVSSEQWRHDLALWAARRRPRTDALPLDRCVVTLNAPELADGALLGNDEFASEASIAASTLRAYITRDEADVPPPQAVSDGGRKRWSRPVVQDWLEQRRRDPSEVATVLTGDSEDLLPPGLRTLWKRLSEILFGNLWGRQGSRRRWSRPYRNEQAVRSVADQVAWTAALHLDSTVPFHAVADAIEKAVLWELAEFSERGRRILNGYIAFMPNTGQLLGWFIQHKPSRVPTLFGGIVREAEQRLNIPPEVTTKSLREALEIDGGFDDLDQQLDEFFQVTLPPTS